MTNCIIIHGCPSDAEKAKNADTRTYDKHWIQWLKRQLVDAGIPAVTPAMPEPWAPDYHAFKTEFEKQDINEDTVLVGHSCGCAFLVRWLSESQQKIKHLVLVAPWKIPDGTDEARIKFYTYPIDPETKSRIGQVTIFTADNEENDGKKSAAMFQEALGGQIIELQGHGHYTLGDMGTVEFPELLATITQND